MQRVEIPTDRRQVPVEPAADVLFERLLGEAELASGDRLRVRWLQFRGSDRPLLSIWLYTPGADGAWWPIPGKGIRITAPHVLTIADALDAARPFAEEWERHWKAKKTREPQHRRGRTWRSRRDGDHEPPAA